MSSSTKNTLFEKVWTQHLVVDETMNSPAILYIDLHLIHEVTSPQAFAVLKQNNISVRRTDLSLATMDHSTPTFPVKSFKDLQIIVGKEASKQILTMEENCRDFGIKLHDFKSKSRGIVHIIGPELGVTQPGKTIVCGDSHTSTHGAFGSLAFGIGTTEVGHVLATQCVLQRKPKTFLVSVSGKLRSGVTAKDIILAIIAKIGVSGGTGHVIEYRGDTISSMDMESRMTICNMSIEAGARAGMIAPDDNTYNYLHDKPYSPSGRNWDEALTRWRTLPSDEDANFDKTVHIDANHLGPMVTFGTNPGMAISINDPIPNSNGNQSLKKSLEYMKLTPGKLLTESSIDFVFVGSCTNSRISDLKLVAKILDSRKISPNVKMIIVPGSQKIKVQAETLGLDQIFKSAGAEWREPGCSMCIAMNGDIVPPNQLCVSTSNRNFEGRQGKASRTILASPMTAAASAIKGSIADPRDFLRV